MLFVNWCDFFLLSLCYVFSFVGCCLLYFMLPCCFWLYYCCARTLIITTTISSSHFLIFLILPKLYYLVSNSIIFTNSIFQPTTSCSFSCVQFPDNQSLLHDAYLLIKKKLELAVRLVLIVYLPSLQSFRSV